MGQSPTGPDHQEVACGQELARVQVLVLGQMRLNAQGNHQAGQIARTSIDSAFLFLPELF